MNRLRGPQCCPVTASVDGIGHEPAGAAFEDVKNWRLFDADSGIDSALKMREYFIPDFSNWKDHDSYQKAFQRLVSDLKAEASSDYLRANTV